MKKSCAFVIPLHLKHFGYGYYIFNELKNTDADLYFIFTDINDKNIFISKLDSSELKYLILSDFVDINLVSKINSFVSIKKLYALLTLYKNYDYISCIDSEIKILNKNNFYDIMDKIANSKIIAGGLLHERVSEINIVRESLLRLTDVMYHDKLTEISNNFRIYTWWSNLPVYNCQYVENFLKWINFNKDENNIKKFCWHIFDDMTYNFYCVLFHDFKIIKIPECYHSLEFANTKIVEYVDKNITKIYWVNNLAYNQNIEYYKNNDFKIVFHLDRWKNLH